MTMRAMDAKQCAWFIKHYKHTTNEEIERKLCISTTTLHRWARRFNLKKSPQFMRKAILRANTAAVEAVKNETGEAKRRRAENAIRNSSKTRFKAGVYAHANRTAEELALINEKRVKTWKATRKSEELRLNWGLEQRHHFRFAKSQDPKKQKAMCGTRYRLKNNGYIFKRGSMVVYYTPDTKRGARIEKNAQKLGFIFKDIDDGNIYT